MKRINFMLALLVMLALMGCKDGNDGPDYNEQPRIYVAISDQFNSYVHDIEGNVIYECPQNSRIVKLASEGKDWYAVRSRHAENNYNSVLYEVLKNGTVQFQIPYMAKGMCVENGDVYTYQLDKNDAYIFIYKNDQQLYKFDANDSEFVYNSFDVVDGHLVAGIYSRNPPTYWIDGKKMMLDINTTFSQFSMEAYAREGTEDLFVIRDDDDESIWYQFKGQSHGLPSAFLVSQAMIVDGVPYILALNRDLDQALLYVNGYKYLLNRRPLKDNDEYDWWRGMMRRYGNDVYVLTNTQGEHSQIYKRNEPIDMSARIELRNVAGGNERVKALSDFNLVDFIVLPPK